MNCCDFYVGFVDITEVVGGLRKKKVCVIRNSRNSKVTIVNQL